MSPLSAREESFACVNYAEFGDLSTVRLQLYSFTRIDYCNAIFAGAQKRLTDKLERMFLIVSLTRTLPWSTGVFIARLRSTWWIADLAT